MEYLNSGYAAGALQDVEREVKKPHEYGRPVTDVPRCLWPVCGRDGYPLYLVIHPSLERRLHQIQNVIYIFHRHCRLNLTNSSSIFQMKFVFCRFLITWIKVP